jgi:hypothetical protein
LLRDQRWNRLILQQRSNLAIFGESSAAVKGSKFNDEVYVDFLRIHRSNEIIASAHSTACSEEVIVKDYDVIFVDSIAMKFDHIDAILFSVRFLDSNGGEFTRFTSGHETAAELISEDRTADETARFDTYDFSNATILVKFYEFIAHKVESLAILQEGGKIAKDDTL